MGIAGKNLSIVGNRSLLQRAIEVCRAATSVALFVVTTEDAAIGSMAEQLGAGLVWRQDHLASDTATFKSALVHALDEGESADTVLPPFTMMVHCTTPFASSDDLDAVAQAMAIDGADSCSTAPRTYRFLGPVEIDGQVVAFKHDPGRCLLHPKMEPQFIETGARYGFRIDGLRVRGNGFFSPVMTAETDAWRSVEIDDLLDLTPPQMPSMQVEL